MPGVPGLEHVEGFRSAHLADDDAIGPQPQRRAHQIGQRGDAGLGAQRHAIGRRALELARVLQDDDALAEIGDLGQQGVDQRGLARRRAADHQDVLALAHRERQHLGLAHRHDARRHVVGEPVEHVGRLAHGKAGRRRDGRHHALEALARLRQLGRDDRRLVGDLAAHVGGDQADDALGLGAADALAGILAPDRGALDPQLAVGVDHHLDHASDRPAPRRWSGPNAVRSICRRRPCASSAAAREKRSAMAVSLAVVRPRGRWISARVGCASRRPAGFERARRPARWRTGPACRRRSISSTSDTRRRSSARRRPTWATNTSKRSLAEQRAPAPARFRGRGGVMVRK